MATFDANGILFYEETDAVSPLHTLLNAGQQSVSDAFSGMTRIYVVQNTTEREALVALYPPTTSAPLYVHRVDAGSGRELERTLDGTNWQTYRVQPPPTLDTSAIVGTYTGQPITKRYINKVISPDGNGDTIIMTAATYSGGGILTAHLAAASTFDIRFSFRLSSGNLVARSFQTSGAVVTTSHTVTGSIDYWVP